MERRGGSTAVIGDMTRKIIMKWMEKSLVENYEKPSVAKSTLKRPSDHVPGQSLLISEPLRKKMKIASNSLVQCWLLAVTVRTRYSFI